MNNKIIVLVGPTAVGKTYVSIELAKKFNTEILSADSMQIYKYMDIGTAKVTEEEKLDIPHHMIDVIFPNENYSVSDFKMKSEEIMDDMLKNNKIPIVVGGSGLYVNSLIYDLDFGNTKSDKNIRDHFTALYEEHGEDFLHEKLKQVDIESADKIHKNNVKRVIRALEFYEITGEKFSNYNQDIRKKSSKYDFILIGLNMERKFLYDRINQRVDKMISDGLLDEVKMLLEKDYKKDLVSMQGIGYKEIVDYLENSISLEEAVNILKRNTRRFAKRQFTWFLKDKSVQWFDIENVEDIDLVVENIYTHIIKNHINKQ